MNKIASTVVVSILLLSLVAGCGGSTVNAYYDPAENIDSRMNKEFVVLIALDSNPSTGYSWEAHFDGTMLELAEESFEPGEYAKLGMVGAGGTELFRFKAIGKGNTDITFNYKRSWEAEILDTQVFTVVIE
jgi:inhibitor of cysteine peptidase